MKRSRNPTCWFVLAAGLLLIGASGWQWSRQGTAGLTSQQAQYLIHHGTDAEARLACFAALLHAQRSVAALRVALSRGGKTADHATAFLKAIREQIDQ